MDYPQEQTHANTKQWVIIGMLVIIIAAIGILLVLKLMPTHLEIAQQQADLIRWEQTGKIDNIPLAQQHFKYITQLAEKKSRTCARVSTPWPYSDLVKSTGWE